jgi:hypothetical protein
VKVPAIAFGRGRVRKFVHTSRLRPTLGAQPSNGNFDGWSIGFPKDHILAANPRIVSFDGEIASVVRPNFAR